MSATENPELRKTAQHFAIYAVGTTLRRVSGLVMLPIYTRYLSPADYGVVELLTMTINILGILVSLRMGQALFRYYILGDNEDRQRLVVSTVLLTVTATGGIGTLLLYLGATSLSRLVFGSTEYVYEFSLIALTLATNAISAVGLSYLRARQMPVVFVSVGAAVLLFEIVLNVYFVVIRDLHVTGVVYSAVISGLVLATGLSLYVFGKSGFRYSRRLAAELVGFALPLVMAGFGSIYVAFAGRYFLRLFGGLEDVGLYALAFRLASVLSTAFEAFNTTWAADRFEIVKKENAREIFAQFFRFLSAIMVPAGAALAIFASDFLHIMTIPAFYPAARIVPILIVAITFRLFGSYCNFGAVYIGRTRIFAEASWARAILATAGFVLLIPPAGVYGAAVALLAGNALEFAWLYSRSKALYDMGLAWRPVLWMVTAAMAVTLPTLPLPAGEPVFFVLRLTAFVALVLIVIFMPVWRQDEREMVKRALASLLRWRLP